MVDVMERHLKPPFILKSIVNPALTALGVGTILVTYGRHSGRRHQVPVNLLTVGDVQYLVASWGVTDWSRNLAANPDAELRHGRTSRRVRAVPVSDADKPPLISAYLKAWGRRPGVLQQFEKIPDPKDHPVFRLQVVS
jgi:deazaflavin-dependent oxidoreductase (nitroreductase family)